MPKQIVMLYGFSGDIRHGSWLPVQALFTLFKEAEKPTRIGGPSGKISTNQIDENLGGISQLKIFGNKQLLTFD